MKASELREMNPDEMERVLSDKQTQLFTIRSQAVTEKIENSKGISNIKRDIARVKTVIRENQLKGH